MRLFRLFGAVRRRPAVLAPLAIVGCLALTPVLGLEATGRISPAAAGGPAANEPGALADTVRLESIAGKVNDQSISIIIQASEPVPYVVEQPDPLTVLVDLRHVTTSGVSNRFAAVPQDAVAGVTVEDIKGPDGADVARVRVLLTRAIEPRVRSQRNVIRIEVDRHGPSVSPAAFARREKPAASTPPSAPSAPTSPTEKSAAVLQALAAQATPPPQAARPDPQQAPQQAPPQIQQLGQKPPEKQYTGAPISLDFTGADIRMVLRSFVDFSNLNIFIDPKVQGTVDISMRDVPWDQALDFILKSNNLSYVVDGTIVRIAPISVLADEESQRRKLAEEQALGGELSTLTYALNYANAEDMRNVLQHSQAVTKRGQVEIDKRSNSLVIRDLPAAMPTIKDILASLDKAQPQVEIEARIVQTNRTFAKQLGVQWGFSGNVSPALGNTTPLAFPNSGSIDGRTGATQGAANTGTVVNMPTTTPPTSAIGLSLGSVNGAFNLDVALSALETSGQGRLLSTPRVLAQNNFAAEMTQGVQIPIQTVANNTVTVQFKDAALKLVCTPQITASGTVIMNIELENATPDYTKSINNIPPINTQRAKTQVLVRDNETIVIGGIYVSNEQAQNDRTPALYRVPLLGWLFKRDILSDETRELLIFITPRILK